MKEDDLSMTIRHIRHVTIVVLCFVLLTIELMIAMQATANSTTLATNSIKLQLTSSTATTISIKWTDSKPATGTVNYTIFRNGTKIASAGSAAVRTFTDRNLKANTKYSYLVKATGKNGVSLRASQTLHTTTKAAPDTQPPTTPSSFGGIALSETEIRIQWQVSTDNVKVLGYVIFRDNVRIALVPNLEFLDKELEEDTSYEYTIRAMDAAKNMSQPTASLAIRTKKVIVNPEPTEFISELPQVYIRGSFNNFATDTKMTLVADYRWQATVTFSGEQNHRFKFDVYGDWQQNYGDNNKDGIADAGARNISVPNGAGDYKITFDEQTLAYTVALIGTEDPSDPTDPTDPTDPVDPPVDVTPAVELDFEAYTLQAGEIDYLHASIKGSITDKQLVWSSNNSEVLSVSNETVKAIAPGNATVRVALADNPTVFDTMTVVVSPSTRHPVYNDVDLNYVFDQTALPEMTVEISEVEWNKLLLNFDKNPKNETEVMADFSFNKNGTVDTLQQIGFRLRGNTSRVRPEGVKGQLHNAKKPDWHHAHFALKFSKFNKAQRFRGMQDMNAKWFKDDALYAREVYSYDLHRRFNVWTAPMSSYARLTIKIKESKQTAYYGVYQMVEAINQDFLNKRFPKDSSGSAPGSLWKGTYPSTGPADLTTSNLDKKIGIEDADLNIFKTYDLKTNKKTIETGAKPQLVSFIQQLNSSKANKQWLEQNINIDLFLKSLATSVTLGSWDDYWVLGNNYFMYFDEKGMMHWIPYDFDNTLGTSYMNIDSGKQDVLRWGSLNNSRPLVSKIMAVPEFKQKYSGYLKELINPANNLFDEKKSVARIKAWHNLVAPYVVNDTGQDMEIADRPAKWGNASYYRLLSGDETTNFFKAKTAAINKLP
jgi:spore coat protein H